MWELREFLIGPNDMGQRLDRFIAKAMPSLPFSLIQKATRTKKIKIDGKRAKTGEILQAGQVVSVYLSTSPANAGAIWRDASFSNIDVVFEDDHILLLHKKLS